MDNAVEIVMEKSGIKSLNPVQKKAVEAGLLEGKNMVLASPTASGKTLVAEFAILKTILEKGMKAVYIVPLRALASEKYEDFKEKYSSLGIKTALSIGDYDQSDPWLAKYDLIIVTSEKFDSLLRHGIPWIDKIGLVVIDEIHLLNDPGRGPTLEITITKLRELVNPQILALSATIQNYKEIAEWLSAEAVKSDYRPIKLYKGVYLDRKVFYYPERPELEIKNEHSPDVELVEHTITMGKQALIFVSTRRNTESLSKNLGKIVKRYLKPDEMEELKKISEDILNAIEKPTAQCEKLSNIVLDGVAFHHAGLTNEQRKIIENGFKKGIVKAIVATPTLAWGVNLPAYRVVIRDLKRFSSGYGSDYIPVLEIHQMMGRAGRPKYDDSGEAILMSKNRAEAEFVYDVYVMGEPEKIQSKLGVEPVLRMHILALIASGITTTKQNLFNFFSKTFYAYQYEDFEDLKNKIEKVVEMLKEWNFVKGEKPPENENPFRTALDISKDDEKLESTLIGKRVSELYIDPLTAHYIIKSLERSDDKISPFVLLHMICRTIEMKPLLSIKKNDIEKINELLSKYEKEFLEPVPNPWDIEYDDYICAIKTAWLLYEWMDETGEDIILENFGVAPGELRVRLNNGEWLLYAVHELALLLGRKKLLKNIKKVMLRLKYGVREELLPLVVLKGIGRVRARMLYNSNIRSLSELRKIPLESLSRIIGPKLAKSVKEQLNEIKDEQKILDGHSMKL